MENASSPIVEYSSKLKQKEKPGLVNIFYVFSSNSSSLYILLRLSVHFRIAKHLVSRFKAEIVKMYKVLNYFDCDFYRLLMLLEIKNTLAREQGVYQCEITFANKTLTSYAKLSVKSTRVVVKTRNNDISSNIPRGVEHRNGATDTHGTREIIRSQRRVANGTCTKYSGDVCSLYLGQRVVFEKSLQPMAALNDQLERVIKILKQTGKLSKR